jgi:hypothetical protein
MGTTVTSLELGLVLKLPELRRDAPTGALADHRPEYARAATVFTEPDRRMSKSTNSIRHHRITPFTSFNAGVSLQSLMAHIKHVSAQMSLRYGRLFDTTVRAEYERALTLAKDHLSTLPVTSTVTAGRALPLADITGGTAWQDAPAIKSRLAGGFCLRAPTQGACTYANICEHCPNFRTDTSYLPVLAAQRADSETLAKDAE